jgi:hypothetical protein
MQLEYEREQCYKLSEEITSFETEKQEHIAREDFDLAYHIKQQIDAAQANKDTHQSNAQILESNIKHIMLRALLLTNCMFKYTLPSELEATHHDLITTLVQPSWVMSCVLV